MNKDPVFHSEPGNAEIQNSNQEFVKSQLRNNMHEEREDNKK